MKKRIIAMLTMLMFLLSNIIVSVSAAQVVNYTVYAFAYGSTSSGAFRSTVLSRNTTRVYGGATDTVGGYAILIPPNEQSGYLIVAGFQIVATNSASSGWSNPSGYIFTIQPYYYLNSELNAAPYVSGNDTIDHEPFTGVVYVPAHTTNLYLQVYGYGIGQYNTMGARYNSSATIQFVPDTSSSGGGSEQIVDSLQQVNQSIQNIYNEIQSSPEDNQYADQLLEQLDQLMDSIDELTQQIEENTNRPPPESLIPSMPPVLIDPPDVPSQDGRTAISDILATSIITNILIMVFSLAFLRYVLFGKSK